MADDSIPYAPDGYTVPEWQAMIAAADALDYESVQPPNARRSIQALRDGKCYVYFIAGDETPFKIGISTAPHERLASLQTAHWTKLEIVAKVEGGAEQERAYHRQFAEHRLNGEWFERHPVILAEIERLKGLAA